MRRLLLFVSIILMSLSGIRGQSFGETIQDNQIIEIDATQKERNKGVKVTEFDIYRDSGDETDQIALTVQVPVNIEEVGSEIVRNIYIIDFSAYTPQDNPIEGDLINPGRISNCSNYKVESPQTLASQFDDETEDDDLNQEFFTANVTDVDGAFYYQYIYRGPLDLFSSCQVYDRDDVWSVAETKTGRTQYTTALTVNHIRVNRRQVGEAGNETYYYQPSFYSTSFILSWSISQYIFVNAVVASQKRVTAEVIFASVQPLWVDGQITDRTRVHISVQTVMENAYTNHVMMEYVKEAQSGTFALLEEGRTPIVIKAERIGDQVLCEKIRNAELEVALDSDEILYDCYQAWEFSIILPQNVTVNNELEGLFSFQLQLYQCDDLNLQPPNCNPVDNIYEEILANIELDTIVEITAEQESSLKLEVTAIKSKDNSAEFLTSNVLSRGIYHGEQVVVYIQPTQNINKTPGADLISEYGLALSAFLVCIESHIPVNSKLGCLDVEQEYRYIPWMEDDLDVSMNGKMYSREDFEDLKQELNSTQHGWNPETGYYTIEFKNLALSSQSRLYRFTMIFRVDIPDDEENSRKRREVYFKDTGLEFREKRAVTLKTENATVLPPVKDKTEDESGNEDDNNSSEGESASGDVSPGVYESAIVSPGVDDSQTEDKTEDATLPEQDTENEDKEEVEDSQSEEEPEDDSTQRQETKTEDEEEEEEESNETEESEDEIRIETVFSGETVKVGGCPSGTEYISRYEECRPKVSGAKSDLHSSVPMLLFGLASLRILFHLMF